MKNNFTSILLVILHAAAVSVIFTGVKYLSHTFRSVEIVLLYKGMLFVCLLPFVLRRGISALYTDCTGLLVIRGLLTAVASLSFMYALKYVNMTNATALGYLEQTIWVVIGSLFFGEKLTNIKMITILTSLFGAFLVLFPSLAIENADINVISFNPYYCFVFLAVCCWGVNAGVIKRIGKTVKADIQLLYSMFFGLVLSAVIALFNWNQFDIGNFSILLPSSFHPIDLLLLEWQSLKYIVLITSAYFVHSISFFFAVRKSEFALMMPYDYFRLVFIGILNYIMFSESPHILSLVGYCFIILSGLILVRYKIKHTKYNAVNEG